MIMVSGTSLVKLRRAAGGALYTLTPASLPPRQKRCDMVLLEFSMSPLSQGESVSAYVARSLDIIDKSGLPYQLTPMGTIIEGEWAEVMAVVTACFEAMQADCSRISTSIRIDYRAGPGGRLKSKVEAVERRLGRKLST
jgi:uncharacterized protein (TIGR00106 family)